MKLSWLAKFSRNILAAATISALSLSALAADVDTRLLEELYKEAVAEGGELVVWAGGDTSEQLDPLRKAFSEYFPDVKLKVVVDVSKFHDARIDNQLARDTLEVDIAQLQTLHDFTYWKEQGELLDYKPAAWDQIPDEFKDADGAYMGVFIVAFATLLNTDMISVEEGPRDATDFLDPKYKGKLILTYPNDDDAVLYQFHLLIEKYGWDYIDKLLAQEPKFVRGTAIPWVAVADGGYAATFTTSGPLASYPDSKTAFLLPKEDAFLSWPQTAAIFKDTDNPAAAKLYMSWIVSEGFQKNWFQWPIRKDIPAPNGFGSVFDHNTDPVGFTKFMHDRAGLERLRAQLEQVIGPVEGLPPIEAMKEYYKNK